MQIRFGSVIATATAMLVGGAGVAAGPAAAAPPAQQAPGAAGVPQRRRAGHGRRRRRRPAGQADAGLGAGDFTVTVGGQPRRVVTRGVHRRRRGRSRAAPGAARRCRRSARTRASASAACSCSSSIRARSSPATCGRSARRRVAVLLGPDVRRSVVAGADARWPQRRLHLGARPGAGRAQRVIGHGHARSTAGSSAA